MKLSTAFALFGFFFAVAAPLPAAEPELETVCDLSKPSRSALLRERRTALQVDFPLPTPVDPVAAADLPAHPMVDGVPRILSRPPPG